MKRAHVSASFKPFEASRVNFHADKGFWKQCHSVGSFTFLCEWFFCLQFFAGCHWYSTEVLLRHPPLSLPGQLQGNLRTGNCHVTSEVPSPIRTTTFRADVGPRWKKKSRIVEGCFPNTRPFHFFSLAFTSNFPWQLNEYNSTLINNNDQWFGDSRVLSELSSQNHWNFPWTDFNTLKKLVT